MSHSFKERMKEAAISPGRVFREAQGIGSIRSDRAQGCEAGQRHNESCRAGGFAFHPIEMRARSTCIHYHVSLGSQTLTRCNHDKHKFIWFIDYGGRKMRF